MPKRFGYKARSSSKARSLRNIALSDGELARYVTAGDDIVLFGDPFDQLSWVCNDSGWLGGSRAGSVRKVVRLKIEPRRWPLGVAFS